MATPRQRRAPSADLPQDITPELLDLARQLKALSATSLSA